MDVFNKKKTEIPACEYCINYTLQIQLTFVTKFPALYRRQTQRRHAPLPGRLHKLEWAQQAFLQRVG